MAYLEAERTSITDTEGSVYSDLVSVLVYGGAAYPEAIEAFVALLQVYYKWLALYSDPERTGATDDDY